MNKPIVGNVYFNKDWDTEIKVLDVKAVEEKPGVYKKEFYAAPNMVFRVDYETISDSVFDGGPKKGDIEYGRLWSERIYKPIKDKQKGTSVQLGMTEAKMLEIVDQIETMFEHVDNDTWFEICQMLFERADI